MAITSEIIGKLGGGGVEEATVAGREITSSNVVVHTVEVPPGRSVEGRVGRGFSKIRGLATYNPEIKLGGATTTASKTNAATGNSAVITGTSNITISAGSGTTPSTFTGGTVYTAEM